MNITTTACAAIFGLLVLPFHYRSGPIIHAILRGSRFVLGVAGWVILLTLLVGVCVVVWINGDERAGRSVSGPPLLLPVFPAALCLLAWAWTRIERAASRAAVSDDSVPPLCEGCGYDLTAAKLDGRCPECGLEVVKSLRDHQRTLAPTAHRRIQISDAFRSATSIIFRSQEFYARLLVRSSFDDSRKAQRATWLWIVAAAWVWMTCMGVWEEARNREIVVASAMVVVGIWDVPTALSAILKREMDWFQLLIFPLFVAFLTLAVGWLFHRVIGGLVSAFAFGSRAVPYPPVVATVIGFETAFLWVFCVYNGSLVTSFFLISDFWLDPVIRGGFYRVFRLPPEPALVFVGNAILALLWFWRYSRVIKAVRWSNF